MIWAHPRRDSLTATVVADVVASLRDHDLDVDELDLYRSGFDPVLKPMDEPDWNDPDKPFSPEVREHAMRTKAADALVFVFPVWWYSVPAIMKGYIDRVWNYGLFYGDGRRSGIGAARWIGLAGEGIASFRKRGYEEMIAHHLDAGIAGLCGIEDSRVVLLYDALGEGIDDLPGHFLALRRKARAVVSELVATLHEEPRTE